MHAIAFMHFTSYENSDAFVMLTQPEFQTGDAVTEISDSIEHQSQR